jgi:hypothetical protein
LNFDEVGSLNDFLDFPKLETFGHDVVRNAECG